MSPRERVLTAFAHQTTDRAPANYEAHQEVTDHLMQRLGIGQHEELLECLGVDMRGVWFSYDQPASETDEDGCARNMWGLRRRPAEANLDPGRTGSPFSEDTTVDDVYAHPWPSPDALDYSGIRAQCEQHWPTYATFGSPWCPFFHEVGWLLGQERYLVWMHTKPEVVEAITDCVVRYELEVTRRYLEACTGKLDIAYFGNDFGTQRGLVVSPEMWRRFLRAPQQRFFSLAHDFGCKVMLHSCGAIRDIIPDLIEDGVDILNPIQVRAEGMEMAGLVRDFGARLCFHGGVDTQHTLPFGSPEQVRALVRAYRELTRERGGYCLSADQVLMADVPLDNILAMYEENTRG